MFDRKTIIAAALAACLLGGGIPAQAQIGFGIGIGGTPFDNRQDRQRIGQVARGVLTDYLKQSYAQNCPDDKKQKPDICLPLTPYPTMAHLPRGQGQDLPADIQRQVGFVYPGTTYRQVGFTVYLLRLPDWRIDDRVTLESDGWTRRPKK